jgi:hypothetical protein
MQTDEERARDYGRISSEPERITAGVRIPGEGTTPTSHAARSRSALARQPAPPRDTTGTCDDESFGGAQRARSVRPRDERRHASATGLISTPPAPSGRRDSFSRRHPAFATLPTFPSTTPPHPTSPRRSRLAVVRPSPPPRHRRSLSSGAGGSVSRIFSRGGGFPRARLAPFPPFPRTREMSRRGFRRLGGADSGADPGA